MRKIFEDFKKGMEKVRWFARLFAERLKIEISIFRLLYDSNRMRKTREELLKKIGERVMELRGHHDKNILKDTVIADALSEIAKLEESMEATRAKASDIGRVTE